MISTPYIDDLFPFSAESLSLSRGHSPRRDLIQHVLQVVMTHYTSTDALVSGLV